MTVKSAKKIYRQHGKDYSDEEIARRVHFLQKHVACILNAAKKSLAKVRPMKLTLRHK